MDWMKLISFIAIEVPKAVLGVEALVTGAKQGATKKQLAMASLGLATSVASDVVPAELQPAVSAATSLASSAIDNFVYLMNAAKGKSSTPTPIPVTVSEAKDTYTPTPSAPFNNPEWTKDNAQ